MPFDYCDENDVVQTVVVSSTIVTPAQPLVVVTYMLDMRTKKARVVKTPVIAIRHCMEERWHKAAPEDEPLDPDEEKCHASVPDFEEAGYSYMGRHPWTDFLYVNPDGIGVSEIGPAMACRGEWDTRVKQVLWSGCAFVSLPDAPFDEEKLRAFALRHHEEMLRSREGSPEGGEEHE